MKLDRTMRRRSALVAAAAASALVLAACGSTGSTGAGNGSEEAGIDKLNIIVPADPGGGWDQTGRSMQKDLQENDLVSSASVVNIGGAGGTNGLAKLATEKDPNTLMVMGYDYSWSGSARAGGVAPIDSPYMLDVTTAMADFLAKVPAAKLIWGVPYYGRAWTTTTSNLNGQTCSSAGGCDAASWNWRDST